MLEEAGISLYKYSDDMYHVKVSMMMMVMVFNIVSRFHKYNCKNVSPLVETQTN